LIQDVTFSPKFSRSCAIVAEKTFTPLKRVVVWFWCCAIGVLVPFGAW
jgi:hypothetical protein